MNNFITNRKMKINDKYVLNFICRIFYRQFRVNTSLCVICLSVYPLIVFVVSHYYILQPLDFLRCETGN